MKKARQVFTEVFMDNFIVVFHYPSSETQFPFKGTVMLWIGNVTVPNNICLIHNPSFHVQNRLPDPITCDCNLCTEALLIN